MSESWAKGYIKGQCDLLIMSHHKYFRDVAVESKNPTGKGILNSGQSEYLRRLENNGYECLVSNNYNGVFEEIIENMMGVSFFCRCKKYGYISYCSLHVHPSGVHREE